MGWLLLSLHMSLKTFHLYINLQEQAAVLVCAGCHTACLCQMPFLLSCICNTGYRLTKDALLLQMYYLHTLQMA